jgi:hypothetical protein
MCALVDNVSHDDANPTACVQIPEGCAVHNEHVHRKEINVQKRMHGLSLTKECATGTVDVCMSGKTYAQNNECMQNG